METIEIKDYKELVFGENPQQKAAISPIENSVDYELLSRNKELGYIDFLNLSEALKVMGEFFDVNCAVITKEALICGASLGATLDDAYENVIDSDPLSAIGATAGFTKSVTIDIAEHLHQMKIKNVAAPDFDKEAFQYLLETNINIIKINTPLHEIQGFNAQDIKVTQIGILVQEKNMSKLSKENFVVVTDVKPNQEQVEDAIFAWKLSKHLKSKAVVIAKDLCAVAIVQGKTNWAVAAEAAMDIACEASKDAVMAIDGVIDNPQTINAAIQGRIGLIIEAGFGQNSKEIVKVANKSFIPMLHTKIRNNRY